MIPLYPSKFWTYRNGSSTKLWRSTTPMGTCNSFPYSQCLPIKPTTYATSKLLPRRRCPQSTSQRARLKHLHPRRLQPSLEDRLRLQRPRQPFPPLFIQPRAPTHWPWHRHPRQPRPPRPHTRLGSAGDARRLTQSPQEVVRGGRAEEGEVAESGRGHNARVPRH